MTAADTYAELVIAGCSAASARGAELAHACLTTDHFTVPAMAAVFQASRDLPTWPTPTDTEAASWARAHLAGDQPASIWPTELRLLELARRLACPVQDLEDLVARRCVDADETGHYADRLIAAYHERRLQADVVELHELLRQPGPADQKRAARLAAEIAARLEQAS